MKNQTITLEQIAEALNGKLWEKGTMRRVYIDRGHNTKKMGTKTYIYQDDNGNFQVSVYIDCPSQTYQWINSQKEQIIASVMAEIEELTGAQEVEETAATLEANESCSELIGKTIQWTVEAGRKVYTGIDRIVNIDLSKRQPFTTEKFSGDDLGYAFIEGGAIHYGDAGQFITYNVIG